MYDYLIRNARIVNEGRIFEAGIVIHGGRIRSILEKGDAPECRDSFDAAGKNVIPGVIDDQVHFREPGLTHKADIYTESRAALAGGVCSFMEMPNTLPQTTTIEELENKYRIAAEKSAANFGFYLGATNDNIEEIRKLEPGRAAGVKIFMGASTGNMLVDNEASLDAIFAEAGVLIATHCEDESIIRARSEEFRRKYGEEVPVSAHPEIRSEEACYRSSSRAVELAVKHGARLHVLHISTGRELGLFNGTVPLAEKQVTAEVCVHHLCFTDRDYSEKGSLIKWNPAIKTVADRDALRAGLVNNTLDVIATDHAPHTLEEKANPYFRSPSGGPLVQHSLPAMLELGREGVFDLPFLVEKMCHAPARIFGVRDRGFIREGYWADLVILEEDRWTVNRDNILYKCRWSPFEGREFSTRIRASFVNGNLAYEWDGTGHLFHSVPKGMRLEFNSIT